MKITGCSILFSGRAAKYYKDQVIPAKEMKPPEVLMMQNRQVIPLGNQPAADSDLLPGRALDFPTLVLLAPLLIGNGGKHPPIRRQSSEANRKNGYPEGYLA